jgi:hypothetical protein
MGLECMFASELGVPCVKSKRSVSKRERTMDTPDQAAHRQSEDRNSLFSSGAFVLVGSVLNAATWWVVSKEKGTRWV